MYLKYMNESVINVSQNGIFNETEAYVPTLLLHNKVAYADSVAPFQPVHLRSLFWEVHCPLIYIISLTYQRTVQLSRQGAAWSWATRSVYDICQMSPVAAKELNAAD